MFPKFPNPDFSISYTMPNFDPLNLLGVSSALSYVTLISEHKHNYFKIYS